MIPYYTDLYANASSIHNFGLEIKSRVESSRQQIASFLNCNLNDIIFTSGATESINVALKGYAISNRYRGNHILTLKTEHKAVLDTCKYLEEIGFDITYLDVNFDGLIDLEVLKDNITKETILVCIMLVNNETGVIQPFKDISKLVKNTSAVLFSDATQAVGKIPVDVEELEVDMLAFSAHKFHGPKGIGGLYIRNFSNNTVSIQPLHHGGGHEFNLRSGTLNVPAIIGFAKICKIAEEEMAENILKINDLRNYLEELILKFKGTFVNGTSDKRIHNVSNICFSSSDIDWMLSQLDDFALSNGSACTSAIMQPSHVLTAMGLNIKNASNSIRFSLGKFNTKNDVEELYYAISKIIEKK